MGVGTGEILRQTKVAKDTAVKARTQTIITLKTLIVTAPDELRSELDGLFKGALRDRAKAVPHAAGRGQTGAPLARPALARAGLRIETHEQIIDQITQAPAPRIRAAFGIGPDIAEEMPIIAAD